jgi:hypothetical protein
MQQGDVIRCTDKEELIRVDSSLCQQGYNTDFRYEYEGEHGLFIEILTEPSEAAVADPKERMCNDYCRFTQKGYMSEYGGLTQETLEQICNGCPLKEL